MSKKGKEHSTYHHGKDYPKTDEKTTPLHGAPNTNHDTRNKQTGDLIQRRKYDKKGDARVDLDKGHKSHNQQKHSHDFVGTERKPAREMTKKENREFEKANKKKRKM